MSRPAAAWDPARDDVFVCTAVRQITRETATVLLAPRRPSTIRFDAGQYVTVEFVIDGQPVQRCYTIASPPSRPERLALTVKRTPAGVVSPWLHNGGLARGSMVRLGPPQGEFSLERHPAGAYVLLTAGSGITPALSILREAYDLGTDLDAVVVHSQRRPEDVPYLSELRFIAAMHPNVRLHLVCSEHDAADPIALTGHLDADVLGCLVPDLDRREILVCGPDGYRAAARAAALAGGAAETRIHEESFIFAPASPRRTVAGPAGSSYRIEFRDYGVAIDCSSDATVLEAAISAGLDLPFSCTQGLCGTCKSTLAAGEVEMNHAGGIRPREIAAGRLLLCCSTPRSDLVITA